MDSLRDTQAEPVWMDAAGDTQDAPAHPWLDETRIDPVVRRAWRRAFGEPGDPGDTMRDGFRYTGGANRSLQVHDFLLEIAEETGVAMPLTVAFDHQTPEAITRLLHARSWPLFQRPWCVRPGVGTPLFAFPGLGGMGLDMLDIADRLDFAGPVYLCHPRGLDDGEAPLTGMEDVVADQLAVVRSVQPHGPYLLLGYSWGGMVAIEIARRLRAEGETVQWLGTLEPVLSEKHWPLGMWLRYTVRRFRHHWRLLCAKSPTGMLAYAWGRMLPLTGRIARACGIARPFGWHPHEQEHLPEKIDRIWQAELTASDGYRMAPYDGAMTLFASTHGYATEFDLPMVWKRYVRDLHFVWIEGTHMEMMRMPHVAALADGISREIAASGG